MILGDDCILDAGARPLLQVIGSIGEHVGKGVSQLDDGSRASRWIDVDFRSQLLAKPSVEPDLQQQPPYGTAIEFFLGSDDLHQSTRDTRGNQEERPILSSVTLRIQVIMLCGYSDHMPWKVVRLELAANSEFPKGSAGRSYLVRLPLNDDGTINYVNLEAERAHATVRRFWSNQPDLFGTLVRTSTGIAVQFEEGGYSSTQLCTIDANRFLIDDKVMMIGPYGNKRQFRVANIQQVATLLKTQVALPKPLWIGR